MGTLVGYCEKKMSTTQDEVNGITENVANLQLDSVTGEMVSKS